MRPKKQVLVCGNDVMQVGSVACMLRVQGFAVETCDHDGLPGAIKERFWNGIALLEKSHENLAGIAQLIGDDKRIPVLRAKPDVPQDRLLDLMRTLTARKRGPLPTKPTAVLIMTA